MTYDRASIIRNEISLPLLKRFGGDEDDERWLFDSDETFHGEFDDEFFYFKDARIDNRLKLPLSCVELEFEQQ